MRGPWKHNPWYSLLRPYVDACTKFSYRHIRVEGKENIPSDGAVIIAPNHCNTLMDALVVLRSRKAPTVFGARADIFENRTAAAILRFLRILPMVRRRDGLRKVLRNYETIDQVVDVLANGVPFCMFAEGRHRAMHSLLPIGKGICRIAKTAHDALNGGVHASVSPEGQDSPAPSGEENSLRGGQDLPGGKDVYIVPAGIEYGDYFRYRSWVRLRYGRAINVSQIIRENPSLNEHDLYLKLIELISKGISSRIVCLPDDENYPAAIAEFERRFDALHGTPPSEAGLPKKRLTRILLAVLTAPFFALSAVLTAPMWGLGEWICRKKLRDPAFRNTVRFAMSLLGGIIIGIVWAALFFIFLPPLCAILGLIYFFASYSIFYDWLNLVRK